VSSGTIRRRFPPISARLSARTQLAVVQLQRSVVVTRAFDRVPLFRVGWTSGLTPTRSPL